ncbi:hypothetical protein BJ508DRAFT_119034 [Ascobolus immersus RN42]|uniref:Uncharacterized protein n=1 Tax=Ascobolus immersus RN42 TaxID=1160509 RepID=A0A3N4IKK4_ASCIM|nr:hypothetical protein BJ508DRAFT_119034 [Ascobolus immersus RN42]
MSVQICPPSGTTGLAYSTAGAYVPYKALVVELLNNDTGIPYAIDLSKKHGITIRKDTDLWTPIQEHSINLRIPYNAEKQAVSVRISTKDVEAAAPVSHTEFYANMKSTDRIEMKTIFDGVDNGLCMGEWVGRLQYQPITTGGVIIKKELVKDEAHKNEEKTEWVDYVIGMEAGEETKKGMVTVMIYHGNNHKGLPAGNHGADKKKDFNGGAFKVGDEVNRRDTSATWDLVRTLAKVNFHYEVEGKRDMQRRVKLEREKEREMERQRKEQALKEELEAAMKRKQDEFKRMLEKKNRSKVKALRKMMATLSTEEIKSLVTGALEVPSGVAGSDTDSGSNSEDSDSETLYVCQDCGYEDWNEYECYNCGYLKKSENKKYDGECNAESDSINDKDGVEDEDAAESDSNKSSDSGWEHIKEEALAATEAPVTKAPITAPPPAPVSRGWFFSRS